MEHDRRGSPGANPLRGAAAAAALGLMTLGIGFPGGGTVAARPSAIGAAWSGSRGAGGLPALVFVSRRPVPGDPLAVPGLGPAQRTVATGGQLLVREPSGRLRELAPGALYDVSDPAVSFDGRHIAFAGTPHPDSSWRLYAIGADGRGLRQLTRPPAGADDFDPCWIDERRLCFASTRLGEVAQYAEVPVSNLYVVEVTDTGHASAPRRISSERNGAEEPALDPARGELVFARWWFNRHQAAAAGLAGVAHPPLPRDSVNLWQAIALGEDGPRLAFGDLGSRRGTMAYQPAFLADGTPVAVYALNLGLWPRPGALGIQRFAGRVGRAARLAGAAIPDSARDSYTDALGLAAPSACSPAGLPDGRVVFSYAPGARGDLGLYVTDAAGRFAPRLVVDLPGTLELDAAPLVRRTGVRLRALPAAALEERPASLADLPGRAGFTYHSLDVFRSARVAPGAPPRSAGARIRFFAAPRANAESPADTAILIREVPLRPDGSVEARGLPADVPMFEQLVDSLGHVMLSSHGPAHVAGFNAGLPGSASRCLGCHLGHSAIPLPARAARRR